MAKLNSGNSKNNPINTRGKSNVGVKLTQITGKTSDPGTNTKVNDNLTKFTPSTEDPTPPVVQDPPIIQDPGDEVDRPRGDEPKSIPISVTTTIYGTANRTGTAVRVNSTYSTKSLGSRVVGMDVLPYLRTRNIEFKAKKLKPYTTVYPFFDGQDVSAYIVPKILEIEMISGSFIAGETVTGTNLQDENVNLESVSTEKVIQFRLANYDHKYGAFNGGSDTYSTSPYDRNVQLQPYSETSTTLNVDTTSLSDLATGTYGGNIFVGMTLIGNQSGATARVTNRRLVTDAIGTVIGTLFIPNPNVLENPKFGTGTKVFRLTDNPTNSTISGSFFTYATGNFFADGLLTQVQETNLSIRNVEIQTAYTNESRDIQRDITFDFEVPVIPGPPPPPTPIPPPPPTPTPTPTPTPPTLLRPFVLYNGGGQSGNRDVRTILSRASAVKIYVPNPSTGGTTYQPFENISFVGTGGITGTEQGILNAVDTDYQLLNYFEPRFYNPKAGYNGGFDSNRLLFKKLLAILGFGNIAPGTPDVTVSDFKYLWGFGPNGEMPDLGSRFPSYFGGFSQLWLRDVSKALKGVPDDAILYSSPTKTQNSRLTRVEYINAPGVRPGDTSYGPRLSPLNSFLGAQRVTFSTTKLGDLLQNTTNPINYIERLLNQVTNVSVNAYSTLGFVSFFIDGNQRTREVINLEKSASPGTQVFERARQLQAESYGSLLSGTGVFSALQAPTVASTNACINDPLAQTFRIGSDINPSGRFATSVDIYFQSVSEDLPVYVELRPVELGLPTTKIYPFSRVELLPGTIATSEDGSIPTRVEFHAPVYLEGNTEHAIVISSNSTDYNVFCSRLGEVDITTVNLPESEQVLVTTQPILGSLFKSQNASTWTPSQLDDLKFRLNCAFFSESGSVNFFNPILDRSNDQTALLRRDGLEIISRRVRVGLGTTISTSTLADLSSGAFIVQNGVDVIGDFAYATGIATGSLSIVNSGIGYTPSSGVHTFSNVSLTAITGNGRDATASITVTDGIISAAGITSGGTGYQIGDIITANQLGTDPLGRNLRLSVQSLYALNELVIDNVQGDYEVGVAKSIQYFSSSTGIGYSSLNSGNVFADSVVVEREGLDVKVNHRNHGMHSPTNIVRISNATSDIAPVKLVGNIERDSTTDITVSGITTIFNIFENLPVSATNPGYLVMNSEIISYTGISGNSFIGITRGVDSTLQIRHPENSNVYKYELGGVSLRRINTTHTLQDSNVTRPIDLDYYHIKIDTSTNGVDRSTGIGTPKLYFNSTKSTGGGAIEATQNIQYDIAHPIVQTFTPPQTAVTAAIRTIGGTSIDGNEVSFEDKGIEELRLNEDNFFDSPRLICSRVNENTFLEGIMQGNKSMQMSLSLSTRNRYLTPMVDLDRVGMILVNNRVNNPITNYNTDPRVATLVDDPNAFVYASKPIELEFPATSIKIIVSAHLNVYNDIRAFFALMKDVNESPVYFPFPGSSNLSAGKTIDLSYNTGSTDSQIIKTFNIGYESEDLEFRDYEFTINDLESFRFFSIKLIGTSTSQTFPPRIRDLRVLALA